MSLQEQPIIFLRIAWMEKYQGVTESDIPKGAGSYVTKNEDGGEVYNFHPIRGRYYGYARIQRGRNIDLSNLNVPKGTTEIQGVTVVFFAKNPVYGGQYIIGWYKNATLYKNIYYKPVHGRGDWGEYLTYCKKSDGLLLPIEERTFEVEGSGQTNVFYPENHFSPQKMNELWSYITNPTAKIQTKKSKKNTRGWQLDAELRKKIEVAAMDAVAAYFELRGFAIEDVHKQNKGWDLEATKGSKLFHLEVKGTQNNFASVDLTPNEFVQMNSMYKSFRLCVVSNVLDAKKQQTDIFYNIGKHWINEKKQLLKIEKVISGRVSLL